jgi:hypothetical protein
MNPTATTHRYQDGHAGHVTVAGTARHERDFLEIEISASQDEAEYDSDDHASALLHKAKNKTKTTAAVTITKQHHHHHKIPGTRTILVYSLLLVTLMASLSTVVKEAWTWDPARICGQWSNDRNFQDQRVTTTTMHSTTTQTIPRTEFFVARQPRTVFFAGAPWMKQARYQSQSAATHPPPFEGIIP